MRNVTVFFLMLNWACTVAPESPGLGDGGNDAATRDAGPTRDAADHSDVSEPPVDSGSSDSGRIDTGPAAFDTGPADSGAPIADAGDQGDAGEVDQAILHGTVSNAQGGRAYNAVRVCVLNREQDFPCVTTGRDGLYELAVPHNENTTMRFDQGRSAIFPALAQIHVGLGRHVWNHAVLTTGTVSLLARFAQIEIDRRKGHVTFTAADANGDGLAGAEGAMAPMSGQAMYLGGNGIPDRNATQTSSMGTALFANVDPGTVAVTVTKAGHDCAPYPVAVNVNGAWQIPVVAGLMSVVVFRCLPN
jgi:hypothetical protein